MPKKCDATVAPSSLNLGPVFKNKSIMFLHFETDSLDPEESSTFMCNYVYGKFDENGDCTSLVPEMCKFKDVDVPSFFQGKKEYYEILDKYQYDTKESFYKEIHSLLSNHTDIVCAYYSAYHLRVLATEFSRLGLDLPKFYVLDPHVIYSTCYKYNKGKKFTDALNFYSLDLGEIDYSQSGLKFDEFFFNRKNYATLNLCAKMKNDSKCSTFFKSKDLEEFNFAQVYSSALSYLDLKAYFSSKSSSRTIDWSPWYPSPDGKSHRVVDKLIEADENFAREFSVTPKNKKTNQPFDFSILIDDDVYHNIASALFNKCDDDYVYKSTDGILMYSAERNGGALRCKFSTNNRSSLDDFISHISKISGFGFGCEDCTWNIVDYKQVSDIHTGYLSYDKRIE